MKKSFYEILEVSNSASQEAIDTMYQVLQKRYTSLEGKQYPDAANHLKFIQIAYEVISDPVKRNAYDQRIAKDNSTLTEVRQTIQAEQPTIPSQRPAQSEPVTKGADNKVLITPVDLIAQLKEANRNTGPREGFVERIVAIATKPLVAGIVGLVLVGAMAYSFMKPASKSKASTVSAKQVANRSDPLAAAALEAAQKLSFRLEAGINYKEYSTNVSDLAVQVKTYLVSEGANRNPMLGVALEKLLNSHINARDIWAIQIEYPNVYSRYSHNLSKDDYRLTKILNIYPAAEKFVVAEDERGHRLRLDLDEVRSALWVDGRGYLQDAKRLNSGGA